MDVRSQPKAKGRGWLRRRSISLALVAVIGMTFAAYPPAAKWWNAKQHSQITRSYSSLVENGEAAERFNQAVAYNREFPGQTTLAYNEVLATDHSEAIATLKVEAANIDLPVYLGADDATLMKGAGHLPETHLPVGGPSTHSVISAHTGLPTSAMFDPLVGVEVGDEIIVEVLGRDLAYRVIEKTVVDPTEGGGALRVREGQDLLTLLTCTPYSVNTHRLLVTAQRAADPVYHVPITSGLNLVLPPGWFWAYSTGIVGLILLVKAGRIHTENSRNCANPLPAFPSGPAYATMGEEERIEHGKECRNSR